MSLGTSVHAIHANFCNNLVLGEPRCMPTIAWYYATTSQRLHDLSCCSFIAARAIVCSACLERSYVGRLRGARLACTKFANSPQHPRSRPHSTRSLRWTLGSTCCRRGTSHWTRATHTQPLQCMATQAEDLQQPPSQPTTHTSSKGACTPSRNGQLTRTGRYSAGGVR